MRFAHFSLTYRDIAVGVAIMLLAFALRVVVLHDRAVGDPMFAPLPDGSDQQTYVEFAERYDRGDWPDAPFRYQPGFNYFLIVARALVGKSLVQMRLALSLVNALACGLMVAVGWLLTGRRWGGYLSGLLLAVYPVAIFYSTELLVEGIALVYVCIFLLLTLWQRERLSLWRSVLLGLTLGLCTITRTNLGLLWLAWALWLLLHVRNPKRWLVHAAVSGLALAAVIAPVTLWNWQAGDGKFQLITNVGEEEIYRGNNRDSDGTYVKGYIARHTVDKGYTHALLVDIQMYPLRFLELQARKFAIYWSDSEPANNIDYYANGESVSPLLQAIPLDFRILSALGLLGTVALFLRDRRMGVFFALVHLFIFAGVMVIWVVSRVRLPAAASLAATSAYLVVWLVDALRDREPLRCLKPLAPATGALVVVFAFNGWAIDNLPRKVQVDQLPADAHPANIVFDDTLRLVGWRFPDDWPAGETHWAYPNESYAVELYWEVLKPTPNDYSAYIAYVIGENRVLGRDRPIGKVSYPPLGTSGWQPGDIYVEIIGVKFPHDIPQVQAGEMRLDVYLLEGDETDENRTVIDVPMTEPTDAPYVVLHPLVIYDRVARPEAVEGLTALDAAFGGQIALTGYALPESAASGETIHIPMRWQATAEVMQDYTRFLHIMDGDTLAAGSDAPVGGTLVSSTWMPGYPIDETVALQLPDTPGTYQIYTGLYDPQTQERLAVAGADNRVLLGEIVVR